MHIGRIQPAFGGNHAVTRVDADGNLLAIFLDRFSGKGGVFDRRRTQYHAGNAVLEIPVHGFHRADTPADFHFQTGFFRHADKNVLVDQRGVLRAVEIHHVNPLGTRRLKGTGSRQRILGDLVRRGIIALDQTDALSVLDVYRRKNFHIFLIIHSCLFLWKIDQSVNRFLAPEFI